MRRSDLPVPRPANGEDGDVMTAAGARMGGRWASNLREVTTDLSALDSAGRWAVAIPYQGPPVLARFDAWTPEPRVDAVGTWTGPVVDAWTSSLGRQSYVAAVEQTRAAIAAGTVYQANVCRIMSATLPSPADSDVAALHCLLENGNPAPYAGFLRLPVQGVHVAGASPELFLSLRRDSAGRVVKSGPIKGTGRTAADLSEKDAAENIMIVDLVRNDLSRLSSPGTVTVPQLLAVEHHPGLVHLVSYVEGLLLPSAHWPSIIDATFPPGSVTGAPKSTAVRVIDELETESRSYYCGAFGWVDADTGEAELAVSIRTFWIDGDQVKFGTGAGITWGSDAESEWAETDLKAARLTRVAAGVWPHGATPAGVAG
jgi:para-aminobenzoate synthetase component 1